jgi:hypothetical protein
MKTMFGLIAVTLAFAGCKLNSREGNVLNSKEAGKCSFTAANLAKPLDIPEDNRNLTAIAKGQMPPEKRSNADYVHGLIQDHWRKKYDEKTDARQHKPNSVQLIAKIAETLGCPNENSLEAEFNNGKFKDIKLYTDESEDPLGYHREKIPNYAIMNKALRTYGSMSEIATKSPKAAELITKLSNTLAAMPSVKGLVFRGTSLENNILNNIVSTGKMVDPGFVSTSLDIYDGFEFLNKYTNTATHSRVLMIIYGTK